MLDETFAEAIVHQPRHRVLGLKLWPFSFWHAANLDFIESPFAGHTGQLDLAALLLAVKVCRLRYPSQLSTLNSQLRRFIVWRYGAQAAYLAQLNAFCVYLRDYNTGPVFGAKDDSPGLKCPWYLIAVCQTLQNNPRLTLAQAWNTEVGLGAWCNAAHAEARGVPLDILTPELRQTFAEAGIQL